METERIELEDGNWWEVRKRMTVGIQRASEELSSQYITDESGDPKEQYQSIPLKVRLQMNRVMVFKATTDWSYGPVTEQVFENEVPASDYDIVLRRLNELYSSIPLTRTGDSLQRT